MKIHNIIRSKVFILVSIIIFSVVLRIYLSQFDGFGYDIYNFKIWSRTVYYSGFQNFYSSVWSDYPPFYMYILWVVGFIYKFLSSNFDINTTTFMILIKGPANLFDIMTSLLIFLIVKKYSEFRTAFLIMLSYLFNPAIIYDSAIWGQVDSVSTFFILLTIFFMVSEKLELAGIFMAVAVLTKPQSLLVLPPFIILAFKMILRKRGKTLKAQISKFIKIYVISLGFFLITAIPFYSKSLKITDILVKIFKPYTGAYNEYAYTSLNAFNIWAFTGFWKPDNKSFLFLSFRLWSYILFGILFLYVMFIITKSNDNKMIYFVFAVIFFGFFMLATRIHERYLFPMFAPLAIMMSLDKRLIFVFWIMTFTYLFNLYYVMNLPFIHYIVQYDYVLMISVINLGILIYAIYCLATFRKIKTIGTNTINRTNIINS